MIYYIGLTQWQHPKWYASTDNQSALSTYAQHFSSVEGNNSFYGIPTEKQIAAWKTETPEHFRFCFKFPKSISHVAELKHCDDELEVFLKRVEPLQQRIGVLWLQMSQQFSATHLPALNAFLSKLPDEFSYGIEVRHSDFFNKQDTERNFNRLLIEHQVNRVMFDTRLLFSHFANDQASRHAMEKKPRVPLHIIATGNMPMVRFISPMNIQLADNELQKWASKALQWIDEGRTPYFFFHTPDNQEAPLLAQRFADIISSKRPDISSITLWNKQPRQETLF
jgi:uncharacterized protein YecE (DUF72 family)